MLARHTPIAFLLALVALATAAQPAAAQAAAAIPFDLPDLCHLSPDDRQLYKNQVTDRERARRAEL